MKYWPTRPLRDLCSISHEHAPEGSSPYLEIGNVNPKTKGYEVSDKPAVKGAVLAEEGDVIISRVRPTRGAIALLREKRLAISSAFTVLRPQNEVEQNFLFFALAWNNTFLTYLGSHSKGALYPTVPEKAVLAFEVPVPPLAEQKRIVELLYEADELRKLRARADSRTCELIPALFNEMFGDTYDWPTERLDQLCKRITVGHVGPMATEYCETGIPFLRGQNIKRGFIDLAAVLFVSESFHRRLAKSTIRPGDVVSVRTGKPGTTAVVPTSLRIANCADLIVMTCGPRLDSAYLCELLNERLGDQDKISGTTGIAQLHFNIGEARKLKIFVPPLCLQQQFSERVNEIRKLEADQGTNRLRLEALFQALLHDAFYGEL